MTTPFVKTAPDPLIPLARRVRWKRCLRSLHRSLWLIAVAVLVCLAIDMLIGMRTLSLRVASGVVLGLAVALVVASWLAAWFARLDRVGLAQLLEKRFPDLAERLVTLVQLDADENPSSLAPLLRAETEQRLTEIDPTEACSLHRERTQWARSAFVLALLFTGLAFLPAFGSFARRFVGAWTTPLVPFAIGVPGDMYALRGGSCTIEATCRMLDDHADAPVAFELKDEDDPEATITMMSTGDGRLVAELEDLRRARRLRIQAGDVRSEPFEIRLIDAPVFTGQPTLVVDPPAYLPRTGVRTVGFDSKVEILQFSRFTFRLALDQQPIGASLRVKGKTHVAVHPVRWQDGAATGAVEALAASVGTYHADLVLELEHGLSATLPVGEWTVHADSAPRFTQSLRLAGGSPALLSSREYRVTPDDVLKLQTVIEDDEGLGGIFFEYRINDGDALLEKWLDGGGAKKLVVDDWLPLPSSLKETDRVQFRIHATDNRRLKKGELGQTPVAVPAEDLAPHVTIAPGNFGGGDAWIALRVDRGVDNFLKQQAKAQADEIRDVIGKIKQKLQNETNQLEQLQRMIHQQSALTPAQTKQAEKLRALNLEITEDLRAAGERFGAIPELGRLAEHFQEIAEIDMMKSYQALQRFSEKGRPLADAETELPAAQDALLQARKKLDRMLDWNKLLAQDRLDQFQIEKLLKRQNDLAQRLEKLLASQPASDADLAKEIEAIRAEQAKLAEQTAELEEKSRQVKDAVESAQEMHARKLAEQAQQLAMEQRAMADAPPEKLSAEVKKRLDELADRQADLAKRVQPLAKMSPRPEATPAQAAANALRKPNLDEAIAQQKEHEKLLKDRLKDADIQPRVAQVEAFLREQKKLRAETERLRGDLAKAGGGGAGKHPLGDKTQKLASELMELSQKGAPETKAMAKEAAQAVDTAKKAMEASQAEKAKGNVEEAKKMDAAAEKQLDFAFKQMNKLAQDQKEKMAKQGDPKTADALKDSGTQMRVAEKKLPTMPKDAQGAMKSAAKSLAQAAQQAGRQSASKLPQAGRSPAVSMPGPGGKFIRSLPKDFKLEPLGGKTWGELPGQLKTEMLQDVRARFGEEYAEMIRQYFDRLAETPARTKE